MNREDSEGSQKAERRLHLLAALHVALAVVAAVLACSALFAVLAGVLMMLGWVGRGNPPAWAGSMFVVTGLCFFVLGWAWVFLLLFAGRFLARARRRRFCVVVALLNLVFVPLGTLLGIFTLAELAAPHARRQFEEQRAA